MSRIEKIRNEIQSSIDAKRTVLDDAQLLSAIERIADCITDVLNHGGKLLICGNGGSASDALHIVGELVGRFQKERTGYCAIALNADVATITAIANDYGYDQIFARQAEGLMRPGDVLLGISTSGNSANIIKAFEKAHEIGGKTILFTGRDGGKLKKLSDLVFIAPGNETAHIQEVHECVYHILCGMIEEALT